MRALGPFRSYAGGIVDDQPQDNPGRKRRSRAFEHDQPRAAGRREHLGQPHHPPVLLDQHRSGAVALDTGRAAGCGPALDPVRHPADRQSPPQQLLRQRVGVLSLHFLDSGTARPRAVRSDLDARDGVAQRRCQVDGLPVATDLDAETPRYRLALVARARDGREATRVKAVGSGRRHGGATGERERRQAGEQGERRRIVTARNEARPGPSRPASHGYSAIFRRAMVDFSNSLPGSWVRTSRSSLRAPSWSPDAHSTSARWMATSASGFAL